MSMISHLPAYTQAAIKKTLLEKGCSGTIYALAFPESRRIIEDVVDGGSRDQMIDDLVAQFSQASLSVEDFANRVKQRLAMARSEFTGIFEAAWTSRQDAVDKQLFSAWRKWVHQVVSIPNELWAHTYPTAGASEGLRQLINDYGQRARRDQFTPRIHVFEGEYEGYFSYAMAAHIDVVKHDRANWRQSISMIGEKDQFYISQPSAVDGTIWPDFDEFATTLAQQKPKVDLMLDLTYVGSVAKPYNIDSNHDNIKAVVFSLSKPFGVYYHRIGGLLSRQEMPSLLGNKWFKILPSIRFGTAILERSTDPWELPRKYQDYRDQAIAEISSKLGIDFKASDVLLFATAPADCAHDELSQSLLRGSLSERRVRVCITPTLAQIIPGATIIDPENTTIFLPSAVQGLSIGDMQP